MKIMDDRVGQLLQKALALLKIQLQHAAAFASGVFAKAR
jgi:hypothetical protein